MKKSAYLLSLLMILLPVSGCLSSEEEVPGCPDNPPDGTACLEWDALEGRLWASHADLGMADLRDAELMGAIMWKANLSGADLSGADLRGANLRGADLSGADLSGANLKGAISDFQTNWEGAIVDKAGLIVLEPGSKLDGVDLTRYFADLGIGWLPEEEGWITVEEEDLWFIINTTAADLSGATLSNSNMSGVNLKITNFSGANLRGADLSRTDLLLANLSGADLSGANLSGSRMLFADFSGADLSNAELFDIMNSGLRGCPSHLPEGWSCLFPESGRSGSECPTEDDESTRAEFNGVLEALNLPEYCDGLLLGRDSILTGSVDLAGYNLSGVDLSGAELIYLGSYGPLMGCPDSLPEGFDCKGDYLLGNYSWIEGVDFSGLDLNGVKLAGSHIANSNFSGGNLSSASLRGANMSAADLSGADLSSASLRGANLYDTNLSGADLSGADLHGANLNGADLSGTIWYGTICPDGTNSDDNGNTCENNL